MCVKMSEYELFFETAKESKRERERGREVEKYTIDNLFNGYIKHMKLNDFL